VYGKQAAKKFYKRYKNSDGVVVADKIKLIMGKCKDVFISHNWDKDGEGRDNHARVLAMSKY
jgi:hypothetical protein